MPVLDIGQGPGTGTVGSTCQPWAEPGDVCAPCNDYDFPEDMLLEGIQLATDVLNNLTGWRWPGECDDTVRPCAPRTPGYCGCSSSRRCGCKRLSEIELPQGPIREITEVIIDGEVVDPARYRVDDMRWLVYLPAEDDERQGWPCCQDLALSDSEVGTWAVSYVYGRLPPLGGRRAAATLGCQYALACSDDEDLMGQCELPERITSIVRQGISMAVLDPLDLFDAGRTGVATVDGWLGSIRYASSHRPATVMVPGIGAIATRPQSMT